MATSQTVAGWPAGAAHQGATGARRHASIGRWGVERIAYLDGLKVLLVAVIIAGHGAMGYSDLENAWPYQDVQEVALPHYVDVVLGAVVVPAALFSMGLFFLLSGLVTPGSLARKGARRFARDRVLRLGVPLLVWVLAVWPALVYAVHRAAGERRGYWAQFIRADPLLDTGPMWFVEVLLIYSLGYAAWRAYRARDPAVTAADRLPRALSAGGLSGLAAAVSLGTVLVRLVFPLASQQPAHPNLWQWPQYLVLFALGVVAARCGWLQPVPGELERRARLMAMSGLLAFIALGLTLGATGVDADVLFHHRLHWAPITLAVIEGPLAVGVSLWLLAIAQRRLARPLGALGRALARGAFAAFILQGAVLIGLQLALRPLDLPAEVKALTVALAGTAGSFALGWLLVARTPLGRVL
jgi:Acyltransferase family